MIQTIVLPNHFHIFMLVVYDERRNPVDFWVMGDKGQGQLNLVLVVYYGHDTVHRFCPITFNFTCNLCMMR